MKVDKSIRDFLIDVQREKRVSLEGNILKLIEADSDDIEFSRYLQDAIEKDKSTRKRRLEVTKQVQEQNNELLNWKKENQELMKNLKAAFLEAENAKIEAINSKEDADASRIEAEKAKDAALNDLDVLQRKSQTELISTIVKVALSVIISVGLITTCLYVVAIWLGKDTQIIGSTWSNMFGILLTNAFSIVGTIMGVKYASENKNN